MFSCALRYAAAITLPLILLAIIDTISLIFISRHADYYYAIAITRDAATLVAACCLLIRADAYHVVRRCRLMLLMLLSPLLPCH